MKGRVLALAVIALAVSATFAPARHFAFLNWDDQYVIVENAALAGPGVASWAFTTTYMEHYQPLSWLAWAGLRTAGEPDPRLFHSANILLHVVVSLLVWLVARRLLTAGPWGQSPSSPGSVAVQETAAAATALVYAVHPLRVEVVAWVSAMPYTLATAFALASVWCWLRAARGPHTSWVAVALFALSLLARPVALGLPVVLVTLLWRFGRSWSAALSRTWPFVVLAVAAGVAELVARQQGAADVPVAFRLESAASAPFVYLWHTVWPAALTPLDALPLNPQANLPRLVAAVAGLLLVSALAWAFRRAAPAGLAAWVAFLALLGPAVGLVPSGLQATADRYTYLPGIVLIMAAVGSTFAWTRAHQPRATIALAGTLAVVVACVLTTRAILPHWADSQALWTRVVDLDPRNDVGHYNLAVALATAGETDAAAERYRAVLTLNPAHTEARANLDRLDSARLEREGNDLAAQGRFEDAAARYRDAIQRDARRPHAQASLGMALASLGRTREAVPHLREALRLGEDDPDVANTLAGLLLETGEVAEARMLLEAALKAHPDDVTLAHNLARLLVSIPGLPQPDRMRAFRLAEAVAQTTGGRDARALDTLAAALAGIGRLGDARSISAQAAAVASAQGDHELSGQITARARAYR